MTTKTDELKPCPFCGCANIHITPDEVGSGGQWVGPVHVVCGGDCVAGQSGDDRESAIAAWNRRAALQSQSVIDDDHLSIILDVYDNAMQKAFDGREFKNPCKPGTPEHKAWEKGTKEGKKKRDACLPNSISLQSQDMRTVIEALKAAQNNECGPRRPWGSADPDSDEYAHDAFMWDYYQRAIDHARRVEGES